jgi:transposase
MMQTKTLTFGLGELKGYDVRKKALIEVADETRKKIYQEIFSAFRDFARLCNYTTAMLYTGKILKVTLDQLDLNTGYKLILEKMNLDTHLNGMVLNQAFGLAKAHFAGDHGKRLMARGETVLPTHRSDGTHPLCFHQKAVNLYREGNKIYIVYQLFADAWAKQEGLPSWIAFQIRLKKRDNTGFQQLERIYNKDWEHGSGQLVRNKRMQGPKYLMHIVAKYTPDPYKTLSADTIMGIDLGVSVPAAIHFRTNGEPQRWAMCVGNGRMMINARAIVRNEIIRLLRGLKRKDSPLDGPARAAAMKRLKELRQRERRLMKTASQKLAAQIADQAKRNGAGFWQMEDLSLADIKEGKPWLARNWAPGMLIDAIKWQAKQLNAELCFVNPKYTSQRCSKCGNIDRDNRPKAKKGAAYFKCTSDTCGYDDHADKNAARNLSIIGIDNLISNS